jgi:nucleoside-triphosphatase THEP1
MKIAYTMTQGRGGTDMLLAQFADHAERQGLRVCGIVQINTAGAQDGRCDMDIRVLPGGETYRISQNLGQNARGCRLDPDTLEAAVAQVQGHLGPGMDLLIVNKFGKHEANGGGFRPVIAQALSLGIPVVVGLNKLNQPAFDAFADGLAEPAEPELAALMRWLAADPARDVQVA